MAIIRRGEIIATTTPARAMKQIEGRVWEAYVPREYAAELRAHSNLISTQLIAGAARVRILSDHGCPAEGFLPTQPTLEDYYFNLVNQANEKE